MSGGEVAPDKKSPHNRLATTIMPTTVRRAAPEDFIGLLL
jgi:hypothetical protein